MRAQIEIINMEWEGPLTFLEAYEKNGSNDYGVYQYYGDHHVYGLNVLRYIGSAPKQTFGRRLSQYKFEDWDQNIQIYLGRIEKEKKGTLLNDKAWRDMIVRVEKLLIYACTPAENGREVANTPPDANKHKELLILNWGKYGSLLPEVSGYRFTDWLWERRSYEPMGQ